MTVRRHGDPPYALALLHGGPGAAGEMRPVAARLSRRRAALEPWQTARSVAGQVEELRDQLEAEAPLALLGFSWGAWLALLFAAAHPTLVTRLVLVGCGPLEEGQAAAAQRNRLARLEPHEREELALLARRLGERAEDGPRLMEILRKTDDYDALESEPVDFQPEIYRSVWPEAAAMRADGRLLAAVRRVRCPVLAIHGDHDPHPAEGARAPLAAALDDFRFVLLERCGHRPWAERHARDRFYEILERELPQES